MERADFRGAHLQSVVDWAARSPLVDGAVVEPESGGSAASVCAVASVGGIRGYGKGLTRFTALVSALGEAVEQHAARCVPRRALLQAPYRDIADRAFDPRWLCLYSAAQYQRRGFPYQPFDPARPLLWTSGRWLDTGEPVLLPAAAVYLSTTLEAEEALCQVTSNGLAAGASVDDAASRAALEVYERGEFAHAWLSRRPGVSVGAHRLAPEYRSVLDRLSSGGASTRIYLLASRPYVALCIATGDGQRWPGVTLGLGAAWLPLDAAHRAVLEHAQTGPYFARVWGRHERPLPAEPDDIHALEDHALFYCDPRHAGEFEFLTAAGLASLPEATPARIAIADITPPDLENSPFRVVRAVAHGLQSIHYGAGFERTLTPEIEASLHGRAPNAAPIPIA